MKAGWREDGGHAPFHFCFLPTMGRHVIFIVNNGKKKNIMLWLSMKIALVLVISTAPIKAYAWCSAAAATAAAAATCLLRLRQGRLNNFGPPRCHLIGVKRRRRRVYHLHLSNENDDDEVSLPPSTSAAESVTAVTTATATTTTSKTAQPFGQKEYWQEFYRQQQAAAAATDNNNNNNNNFLSWYATWDDLKPFVQEWVTNKHSKILWPGIGSDYRTLFDMYQKDGYTNLAAFDYAPEAIEYCRRKQHSIIMTTETDEQQQQQQQQYSIDLAVADARDLSACYQSKSFDAVLDKGTLDAVFLAGNTPTEKRRNLRDAVRELQRVLRPGGIFWSLSAICVDALSSDWMQEECWKTWQVLTDGSEIYTTCEGYTSNNMDGTLMVWRKPDV